MQILSLKWRDNPFRKSLVCQYISHFGTKRPCGPCASNLYFLRPGTRRQGSTLFQLAAFRYIFLVAPVARSCCLQQYITETVGGGRRQLTTKPAGVICQALPPPCARNGAAGRGEQRRATVIFHGGARRRPAPTLPVSGLPRRFDGVELGVSEFCLQRCPGDKAGSSRNGVSIWAAAAAPESSADGSGICRLRRRSTALPTQLAA